jgi:hypothetical protein
VWADLFGHVAAVQVEAELRRLAQIYAIFSEYTEVVRQYSSMLWSELDIGSLMQGVEGVAGKLKKLKGLEGMPVFGLVQAEIAGFATHEGAEERSTAVSKLHCTAVLQGVACCVCGPFPVFPVRRTQQ